MACRVPDAQENGLVLRTGFGQGLFAPRIPINGVVGVLEQIGGGGCGEFVHVDWMIVSLFCLPDFDPLPLSDRIDQKDLGTALQLSHLDGSFLHLSRFQQVRTEGAGK